VKQKRNHSGGIDVFKHEETVLKKAGELVNDEGLSPRELQEEYKKLLKKYKKLLRETRTITRVGDSNQRKLLAAYDKIELQNLELERARQEADRANRAKSDFLATMSHEIRTPMNAVLGMTELALFTTLTEEQRDYLQTVKEAGQNLLAVINDILDVSKIEAGKLILEQVDFFLEEHLKSLVKLLELSAAHKDLALSLNIGASVPAVVKGDPVRLKQVITNLVGNAVKFTHSGEVTITVTAVFQRRRICLDFAVRDTGIGIPEEKQARIFENFSQADSSTTRQYGGTGLGLSISKRLVELMGGAIAVESQEGKGSTFSFTALFDAGDPEAASQQAAGLELTQSTGKPLHILLAEDNPNNAKLAVIFLNKLGHSVVHAVNGRQALNELSAPDATFDLVLMDLEMPEMDGLETARRIRAHKDGRFAPDTPVIAMTAHSLPEYREKIARAGINHMLTKPLDLHKLSHLLANLQHSSPLPHPGAPPGKERGKKTTFKILHREAALSRMDGDLDMYRKFCSMVREEIPEVQRKLHTGLDKQNLEALRQDAHYVKGSTAMIGAEQASHQASLLEQAVAERRNPDHLSRLLQRLDRELEQLQQILTEEHRSKDFNHSIFDHEGHEENNEK
jgi:signal transduction histidine kinase/CheY-like chemotaxis protein